MLLKNLNRFRFKNSDLLLWTLLENLNPMFALRSHHGLSSSDPHTNQCLGSSSAASLEEEEVLEIDVHTLEQLLINEPKNLILIDVRYPHEYEKAHFIGAVLVPLSTLLKGDGVAQIKSALEGWHQQNGDRPYKLIIYCTRGVRSAEAVRLLQQEGISGLNLADGIWGRRRKIQPSQNQNYLCQNYLYKKEQPIMNIAPLKLAIAPVKSKSIWLAGLALLAIGTVSWGTYKVVHNPDRLKPLLAAGVPLQVLEPLPFLGQAIETAELQQITVQDLKQKIDHHETNYVLVDVRSPEEYQTSKIPGAVSIPLTTIQQGKGVEEVKALLHGRELVMYCTSGQRSAKALIKMKQEGVQGLQVKGGINAWRKEINPSLL